KSFEGDDAVFVFDDGSVVGQEDIEAGLIHRVGVEKRVIGVAEDDFPRRALRGNGEEKGEAGGGKEWKRSDRHGGFVYVVVNASSDFYFYNTGSKVFTRAEVDEAWASSLRGGSSIKKPESGEGFGLGKLNPEIQRLQKVVSLRSEERRRG